MTKNCPLHYNEKGLSLVEIVLVSAAVVFLGILIVSLVSPVASINKSRHTSVALKIASRQIENLRKQTFENLANGTNSFYDANLSTLPSSSASYEVEDCPISICTVEEKAKQVKVEVSWNESGEVKKVDLVTIVGEGGIGQ